MKEWTEWTYEEILECIDSGQELPKDILSFLVYWCAVETIDGDIFRWTMLKTSIVQIKDRYFSIEWEEGLTENQEDFFYEQQPIEVKKKVQVKTITTHEWIPIIGEENDNKKL